MFPTELRRIIDTPEKDIFNMGDYVVNIKNLTIYKGVKSMLENEKAFKLEQLNSLKGEYENKLEAIKAQDVVALVNEKLATVKESIEKEVVVEHEAMIAKTELKLEAINEMIAEVEAIEVEVPVEETAIKETAIEDVQDNIPAEAEAETAEAEII